MLTVDDLKAEIKGYSLDVLTDGNDDVVIGALETSRVWVKARLAGAGIVFDPDLEDSDEVVRRIVVSYALYRLYSYAEQEGVASDKKSDAAELMASYLSAAAARDPVAVPAKPSGAITKTKRKAFP